MREKTRKLVVTFKCTTDAITMERKCKEHQIPGRIVPVPRSISASCGLCWIAEAEEEPKVVAAIDNFGLRSEGRYYRDLI